MTADVSNVLILVHLAIDDALSNTSVPVPSGWLFWSIEVV